MRIRKQKGNRPNKRERKSQIRIQTKQTRRKSSSLRRKKRIPTRRNENWPRKHRTQRQINNNLHLHPRTQNSPKQIPNLQNLTRRRPQIRKRPLLLYFQKRHRLRIQQRSKQHPTNKRRRFQRLQNLNQIRNNPRNPYKPNQFSFPWPINPLPKRRKNQYKSPSRKRRIKHFRRSKFQRFLIILQCWKPLNPQSNSSWKFTEKSLCLGNFCAWFQ